MRPNENTKKEPHFLNAAPEKLLDILY